MECPLTFSDSPIEKVGPNFKSNPKIADILKKAGFNLVTLANNHIYDQGQRGLEDTINHLRNQKLHFLGAGRTLEEAQSTFYITIKNVKLAFINFAEVEFSCANENHGGANPMDLIDNIHQIKTARQNSDLIILIIHGGHEHYQYPSPNTIKRYRFFAESGVDAIISHHTHCIGGYELYNGIPIFYGLGNFLFPAKNKNYSTSWFEGYAVKISIKNLKITFEIIPYEQCKNDEILIKPHSKHSILYQKIIKISQELNEEDLIHSKFKEYLNKKKKYNSLGGLAGLNRYIIFILKKLRFFSLLRFFMSKKHMRLIKQAITCQAHRETSIELLKDFLKY